MVDMKKALLKDTFMEIKNTHKRFISILLIILLGAGFFAGIKAISPDMKIAADKYYDSSNFMDFKLVSTLGITKDDVEEIKKEEYIEDVMPSNSLDAMAFYGQDSFVVKLNTMQLGNANDTGPINKASLLKGRFPEADDECVTEQIFLGVTGASIGDTIEFKTR
ncbi:MAG: hypothetical protein RSD14_02380 [Clostridia bacterium]